MTEEEIGAQAVEMANQIERIAEGKNTRAVLTALSMVLGAAPINIPGLNFELMMREVYEAAKTAYEEYQKDAGHA